MELPWHILEPSSRDNRNTEDMLHTGVNMHSCLRSGTEYVPGIQTAICITVCNCPQVLILLVCTNSTIDLNKN